MYGFKPNKNKLRQCIVNDKLCYFHGWNFNSDAIAPSLFVGGHAGGVVSHTYGIIEFPDGKVNEFIRPGEIKFCDDIYHDLNVMNRYYQGKKKKRGGNKR